MTKRTRTVFHVVERHPIDHQLIIRTYRVTWHVFWSIVRMRGRAGFRFTSRTERHHTVLTQSASIASARGCTHHWLLETVSLPAICGGSHFVSPSGLSPYISEIDLLVFKINNRGLRPAVVRKITDANDATSHLGDLRSKGPISLSSSQKDAVLQGLDDAVQLSGKENLKAWWESALPLN